MSELPLETYPRCLKDVIVRAADDPGFDFDSVVDEWPNEFFALGCPCGSDAFKVESFFSRSSFLPEDRAYGPIHTTCETCRREATIFDPELHGYDVEIDHFPPHPPYLGTWQVYSCPSCGAHAFALTARFQYPTRAGEPHRRADGSFASREDLFSYFTLVGRCSSCEAIGTISSVECA
jgi:hypothetical protein